MFPFRQRLHMTNLPNPHRVLQFRLAQFSDLPESFPFFQTHHPLSLSRRFQHEVLTHVEAAP